MPAEVDISGTSDDNYPAHDDVMNSEDMAVDNMDTPG